jgi:hypothetical protein
VVGRSPDACWQPCSSIATRDHLRFPDDGSPDSGGYPRALVRAGLAQPHSATTSRARVAFVDELHARRFERSDEFHERVHGATDETFAGLHALNGREGQSRRAREGALVYTKQGARGPQLRWCDQWKLQWNDVSNINYNISCFAHHAWYRTLLALPAEHAKRRAPMGSPTDERTRTTQSH